MKRVWIVARHEFITTVKRWGFIFATFALPLVMGLLMGIPIYLQSVAMDRADTQRLTARMGFVDEAGLITLPPPGDWKRYASRDEAAKAMHGDDIQVTVVIPKDYRAKPVLFVLIGLDPTLFHLERHFVRAEFHEWLAQNVLSDVEPDRLKLARMTAREELRFLKPGGAVSDAESSWDYIRRAAGGGVFVLLLFFSLSVAGGYLIQGMVDEKENRVLEMVISSVSPAQLMAGKLIGLGAVSLLQVSIWTVTGGGIAFYLGAVFLVNPVLWLICTIFFLLGYAFFGSLLLGVGSLGSNQREASQYTAGVTILSIAPLILAMSLIDQPQGTLARVLSFIPFTAPVTMMFRYAVDPDRTPLWELLASMAVLGMSTVVAVLVSARLYRIGLLMYGKRPSIRELMRWMRA